MKASEILFNYHLKRTSCREGIIEVMLAANQALSENQIREQLTGNYDRTTFYRSFKTLVENKIIHKIVVDNQLVKYALHHSITQLEEHVHFYCNDCHIVKCLESVHVQHQQLPEGYAETETEVIIKGICANCNQTAG